MRDTRRSKWIKSCSVPTRSEDITKTIGFSAWSITDEQNTLKGKLKSPADVERFKKTFNFGKIVRIAIYVADGYRKMKNIMHHASLKNVF